MEEKEVAPQAVEGEAARDAKTMVGAVKQSLKRSLNLSP